MTGTRLRHRQSIIANNMNEMQTYDEVHRSLLTLIRSLGYINQVDLQKCFQQIYRAINGREVENNEEKVEQYISEINSKIKLHGFKIDRIQDQVSGDIYSLFTNARYDEIIKGSTLYSAAELDALRQIIDDIIQGYGEEYSIGFINAKQKLANVCNKPLKESETMIYKYIDDGWFNLTLNDRLTLSIRSMSELRKYFLDTYGIKKSSLENKLYTCEVCDEICTLGTKCPNRECVICFHYKCREVYLRGSSERGVCPLCKREWLLDGEDLNMQPIGVNPSLIHRV